MSAGFWSLNAAGLALLVFLTGACGSTPSPTDNGQTGTDAEADAAAGDDTAAGTDAAAGDSVTQDTTGNTDGDTSTPPDGSTSDTVDTVDPVDTDAAAQDSQDADAANPDTAKDDSADAVGEDAASPPDVGAPDDATATDDTSASDTIESDTVQSDTAVADGTAGEDASDMTGGDDALTSDIAADVAPPAPGSAKLQVVDTAGLLMVGAEVSINSVDLSADATGLVEFTELPAGEVLVQIRAAGHAPTSRKLTIVSGEMAKEVVVLTPISASFVVLSTAATDVATDQIRLGLPADAFLDSSGNPFVGEITVNFAPLDPTPTALAGAPGPLVGTPTGGSGPVDLTAAFLAEVGFYGPDGAPLQLAPGKLASLTYVLPEATAQAYAEGQVLSTWYFDLASASWKQDGESVVTLDPVTGKKQVTALVSHFTWWMQGSGSTAGGCVQLTVTRDGAPAADIKVYVAGMNSGGFSSVWTDQSGQGCAGAAPGSQVYVQISDFENIQLGGAKILTVPQAAGQCGIPAGCAQVAIEIKGPTGCSGSDAECDDQNPCTVDDCFSPAVGCLHYASTGGGCSDGSTCTEGDMCANGACVGLPVVCNDGNGCTSDKCVSGQGCVTTPNKGLCTDGDGCTLDDVCKGAVCLSGEVSPCNDNNVCTVDSCTAPAGTCVNTPADGNCDDATACTTGDVCTEGKCAGLADNASCEDGNICTADVCDPAFQGCTNPPQDTPCDDGDTCTGGEACKGGTCVASGEKVASALDQELTVDTMAKMTSQSKDMFWQQFTIDQGLANGYLKSVEVSLAGCDKLQELGNLQVSLVEELSGTLGSSSLIAIDSLPATCAPPTLDPAKPGAAVLTFPGLGIPVVAKKTYWLVFSIVGATCEQTIGCQGSVAFGSCYSFECLTKGKLYVAAGGQLPPYAANQRLSFVSVVVDNLNLPNNGKPCDDGIGCTVSDVCTTGKCAGTPDCDDKIACTLDACEKAGCTHTPNDKICEDNDECSVVDLCDAATGCVHPEGQADGKPCTDGNLCTVSGSCLGGKCQLVDKDCEDGDFCSVNYCYRAGGTGSCASDSVDCSDGNECTVDFCTAGKCDPQPQSDNIQCDDGIACTTVSTCQSAVCTPKFGWSSCDVGETCVVNDGCLTEICENGKCAFNTCHDKVLSGDETDVDCGGSCTKKCFAGQKCKVQADCDQASYNKFCSASQGICWSNAN